MTENTSDGRHFPVVIVGAGPTGMTAALLLGRYGVPCLVLDRWEDVYPQPRAVHLDDEAAKKTFSEACPLPAGIPAPW